jgi:hypothetical protein
MDTSPTGDYCPFDPEAPFNTPRLYQCGEYQWMLADDLIYQLRMGAATIDVTVPAGFTTDFASVPRILWNLFPPYGKHARAAILHDYLYSHAGNCSRFLADAFFLETMHDLGVPWLTRNLMYSAVRYFGRTAWRTR